MFLIGSLAVDRYLRDWAVVYLLGGSGFFLVGLITGLLIWRKYRGAAKLAEERNRNTKVKLEEISEDLASIAEHPLPSPTDLTDTEEETIC